jgi:hypothetical protein
VTGDGDLQERLRRLGEAERARLRAAARAGDEKARRALADLGELPPPPRPWCETDADDAEGTDRP